MKSAKAVEDGPDLAPPGSDLWIVNEELEGALRGSITYAREFATKAASRATASSNRPLFAEILAGVPALFAEIFMMMPVSVLQAAHAGRDAPSATAAGSAGLALDFGGYVVRWRRDEIRTVGWQRTMRRGATLVIEGTDGLRRLVPGINPARALEIASDLGFEGVPKWTHGADSWSPKAGRWSTSQRADATAAGLLVGAGVAWWFSLAVPLYFVGVLNGLQLIGALLPAPILGIFAALVTYSFSRRGTGALRRLPVDSSEIMEYKIDVLALIASAAAKAGLPLQGPHRRPFRTIWTVQGGGSVAYWPIGSLWSGPRVDLVGPAKGNPEMDNFMRVFERDVEGAIATTRNAWMLGDDEDETLSPDDEPFDAPAPESGPKDNPSDPEEIMDYPFPPGPPSYRPTPLARGEGRLELAKWKDISWGTSAGEIRLSFVVAFVGALLMIPLLLYGPSFSRTGASSVGYALTGAYLLAVEGTRIQLRFKNENPARLAAARPSRWRTHVWDEGAKALDVAMRIDTALREAARPLVLAGTASNGDVGWESPREELIARVFIDEQENELAVQFETKLARKHADRLFDAIDEALRGASAPTLEKVT